ncbi:hypothetical protein ACN20G_36770 (plasmid) [Streptomyces sp. BI20]|uniref:hypothetical protein n=1 Tax=Streptomyces sp. BI20 TaxID=3403460 RepID=UPI003C7296DD
MLDEVQARRVQVLVDVRLGPVPVDPALLQLRRTIPPHPPGRERRSLHCDEFTDGVIVESWFSMDSFELAKQLGASG